MNDAGPLLRGTQLRGRARADLPHHALLLALVLGQLASCTLHSAPHHCSSPDDLRHTAPEIPLNSAYEDSVDFDSGDVLDFRSLRAAEVGLLTVTCSFDEASPGVVLRLRDAVGREVSRQARAAPGLRTASAQLVAGERSYVELVATAPGARAQYRCELRFETRPAA